MTITPSLVPKPSISTSSWFSVCSLSSCPPPRPEPLWRPTASISSMKIMAGAAFFACSKRSLTRPAPTPTYSSTKSEPEIERKGTLASPATAFARRVLPVPGGPTSRTPFGILAPIWVYLFGSLRKSTISASSCFSSSQPATSLNVFLSLPSALVRVRALENFMTPPAAPPALFIMLYQSAMKMIMMIRYGTKLSHHGATKPSLISYSSIIPLSCCSRMRSERSL